METKLKFKITPFTVPGTVFGELIVEEQPFSAVAGIPAATPPSSSIAIPFKALDAEDLERLCNEFRDEVFRVAGKRRLDLAANDFARSRINELETALAFMVDNIGQPECLGTRDGFDNARRVLDASR